jgi:putative membrane protein
MVIISEADRKRVAAAITVAEARTSGEIVAVIASESASYTYVAFLWAAVAALIVPFPFIYWTWWPIQRIYLLQLIVFAVLVALLMYRPLRLALVPASIKKEQAHRRAVEQFLAQNLYTTLGRTGVLIFVSVAEHYAEIIADAAIHAKVPERTWQVIVDQLTRQISENAASEAFMRAIEAVGQHLAEHFPPGAPDPHVLPNHLIVLPGE